MGNNFFEHYQILDNFNVGFEFEFFSGFEPTKIKELLEKTLLGKEIVLAWNENLDGTRTLQVHSDVLPTANEFKLELDYSGGGNMYEMVTGPMNYHESVIVLQQMFNFIKIYGTTNDRAGLHINMSVNGSGGKTVMNISPLKLCLNLDEEVIFSRFPDRRNNVYASSVKNIYKMSKFINLTEDNYHHVINDTNFITPTTKYYGVNFLKVKDDYLEFRYLGGKDYESKFKETHELMFYFAMLIYKTLDNDGIYIEDYHKLIGILEDQQIVREVTSNLKNINEILPELDLSVDMNNDPEILTLYYTKFVALLEKLIMLSNVKVGEINFDTDASVFQLRGMKIKNMLNFKNIEMIGCEFAGEGSNLKFWDCVISESILTDCNFVTDNSVASSKLKNSVFNPTNEFEDCYIENRNNYDISGIITKSIIRAGTIADDARIDKKTIIVE